MLAAHIKDIIQGRLTSEKRFNMSIQLLISAIMMIVCLSNLAIAEEIDTSSRDIDSAHDSEAFSTCGVGKSEKELWAAATSKPSQKTEITYVSGGICAEEVNFMKGIARHFPLEIVLVQQEEGKEVYIADVNVSLQNAQQEEVLSIVTDGPLLFVNLPDGKYTITAIYHGIEQRKQVNISKKHSRIVLLWKAKQ
jgi:hypothetical protein